MSWFGVGYIPLTPPHYIHHVVNFGAGGLMAQRYIDIVLDPVVVPHMADHRPSI